MPNRVNKLMVAFEREALGACENIVFVDYRGLSSSETEDLRRELREKDLNLRVLRNRIALRAFEELGNTDVAGIITGPTAIIDAECPVTAAKVAAEFAKRHPALELKGGLIEGEIYDQAAIQDLAANGKTKQEWLGSIAGALLAPFKSLASCANVGGKLAGALKSIAEKGGEESGEAA